MNNPRGPIVRAPLLPTYAEVRAALRALDKEPVQLVRDMMSALDEQMGTPQSKVDWSKPEEWIGERLTGNQQKLAAKIWEGSGNTLNPRYLYGAYLCVNNWRLMDHPSDTFLLNERGAQFIRKDAVILREIDAEEGLPKVLALVAERSPCKRGDILSAWSEYLKVVSVFNTDSTFKDTLRRRLINLAERGLLDRDGNFYSITDAGIEWLKGFSDGQSVDLETQTQKRTLVAEAAHKYNEEQLSALFDRLMTLEPYQFEHFVKELLEAMEYQDVVVTKVSNDKGVDVVAKIQFGITEITEVVQVKRTTTTITRPKIDELRGALPYHRALRGTIISLGGFAKGAREGALFSNAAPITLIDGKRLLDLCVKHQVGITRRPVEIYEVDEVFFDEKYAISKSDASD